MTEIIGTAQAHEGDLVRLTFDNPDQQYTTLQGTVEGTLGKAIRLGPGSLVSLSHANVWRIELLERPAPPRIPADALHVSWKPAVEALPQVASRLGDDEWLRQHDDQRFSLDELLNEIGDAEIIVLDPRKEAS